MERKFAAEDGAAPMNLHNVVVEYSRNGLSLTAISGVTASFGDEFVAIVGPSGCGKSTLLRLLAGLLTPTSGEILQPVGVQPRCAMVFQDYSLLPWRTARENIELATELRRQTPIESDALVNRLVNQLGLAGTEHLLPHELSGGMRQRVAIGRALAQEPDMLLMDEPFGALDRITREDLQELLLSVYEQDRPTIVFVTHDVEEAVMLGDRVLVMSSRPGRFIAEIRPPFKRPRGASTRWAPEFVEMRRDIEALLRQSEHSYLSESDNARFPPGGHGQ